MLCSPGWRTDRRTARLTRFVDTNGDAEPEVWDLLVPVTDGVMVDLKALDDDVHVILTGRSNARVRKLPRELAARGVLYEVRLLPIPGLNDSDDQLERTAAWLLSLDPAIRVRVNEFRRFGIRAVARDLRPPRRDRPDPVPQGAVPRRYHQPRGAVTCRRGTGAGRRDRRREEGQAPGGGTRRRSDRALTAGSQRAQSIRTIPLPMIRT